jgi:hypothetical protein
MLRKTVFGFTALGAGKPHFRHRGHTPGRSRIRKQSQHGVRGPGASEPLDPHPDADIS